MPPNPFLDDARRLRSGWWIGIFFVVLASLLLPLLLFARGRGADVSPLQQLSVVLAASATCQALRREPLARLLGPLDRRWPRGFLLGGLGGALLMAVPALFLGLVGVVNWRPGAGGAATLWPELVVLAAAAATEELLFRGFLFRRLLDGLGTWPAQLIIAALFVLTHSDALRGLGPLAYLAGANLFLASVVFGLAYLRTRSLALPFGLHLAANVTQGPILGFGVSGHEGASLLVPVTSGAPDWLSGGKFGLEASVPGLVCVVALLLILRSGRATGSAAPPGSCRPSRPS
ncbi:MAG: CPBP family intramembrane glutamic endopeptidase [Deltaproteobacteria bacterium]